MFKVGDEVKVKAFPELKAAACKIIHITRFEFKSCYFVSDMKKWCRKKGIITEIESPIDEHTEAYGITFEHEEAQCEFVFDAEMLTKVEKAESVVLQSSKVF